MILLAIQFSHHILAFLHRKRLNDGGANVLSVPKKTSDLKLFAKQFLYKFWLLLMGAALCTIFTYVCILPVILSSHFASTVHPFVPRDGGAVEPLLCLHSNCHCCCHEFCQFLAREKCHASCEYHQHMFWT